MEAREIKQRVLVQFLIAPWQGIIEERVQIVLRGGIVAAALALAPLPECARRRLYLCECERRTLPFVDERTWMAIAPRATQSHKLHTLMVQKHFVRKARAAHKKTQVRTSIEEHRVRCLGLIVQAVEAVGQFCVSRSTYLHASGP